MKIDIEKWHAELEVLLEKRLKEDTTLSKAPSDFFDGFFCDAGFPVTPDVYPIWWDDGIVIYVDAMPHIRFESRTGRWKREGDDEYRRLFWISDEGVLGEVAEDNGRITEFFPVNNPNEAVEYFELLRDKKLGADFKSKMRPNSAEDLIEGVYVRFFRFPDDLTEQNDELPWVNLISVQDLVKEHIDKNLQWMSLPLGELTRRRLLDAAKQRGIRDKTIDVTPGDDDPPPQMTHTEFALTLLDAHQDEHKGLRVRCFEAASKLKDADLLPDSGANELIRTALLYAKCGMHYDCRVEFGIELSEIAFAGYLSEQVNPQAFEVITSLVFSRVSEGFARPEKSAVDLPPLIDQKRHAFEARCYRHQIHRHSQRLERVEIGKSPAPTATDLRKLLANRFEEVLYLADRVPEPNAELDRAKHPLPYFMEAVFLAWERAPEKLKVQNGLASFGNLIRVVALLGLTELQAVRPELGQFSSPADDLMKGVTGNPSLGHWSRFLDYLGSYLPHLPFFKGWLDALLVRRKAMIELIELRNKYSHPASSIEQGLLDDLVSKLHEFLGDVSHSLRQSGGSLSIFLPRVRKAIRSRIGGIEFQFSGYDLASPYDRFFEANHTFSEATATGLIEDELTFIHKGARCLSVNRFFRFREMKPGEYEVSIYEKGFDGRTGIFTGISTGIQEKLPMETAALLLR